MTANPYIDAPHYTPQYRPDHSYVCATILPYDEKETPRIGIFPGVERMQDAIEDAAAYVREVCKRMPPPVMNQNIKIRVAIWYVPDTFVQSIIDRDIGINALTTIPKKHRQTIEVTIQRTLDTKSPFVADPDSEPSLNAFYKGGSAN